MSVTRKPGEWGSEFPSLAKFLCDKGLFHTHAEVRRMVNFNMIHVNGALCDDASKILDSTVKSVSVKKKAVDTKASFDEWIEFFF